MQRNILEKLASEKNNPCVTISLNTHRNRPESEMDALTLKALLTEVKSKLINDFEKIKISDLLDKIKSLEDEIDIKYNLDSLHIFLSNTTKEIIKSPSSIEKNTFQISDNFAVKPLIKELNRMEEYLIMLLSPTEIRLFHAINSTILKEINNDDFPFDKNPHVVTEHHQLSNAKLVDNKLREYLNNVDKALVKVFRQTDMKCVVVCTDENYSILTKVADVPSIYIGHVAVNYNNASYQTISENAWQVILAIQQQRRSDAIVEMQEAVGQGKVLTDLTEIFIAAKQGQGELLIAHENFHQAVNITGDFSFDLTTNSSQSDSHEDITNLIAWEVISKKGRVVFTDDVKIKSLGYIALKVRY